LVSKRRRLRRKDQAIAEVDSDKATLELPAEASGIITLKAERRCSSSRAVVCLIDTAAAKPEGSAQQRQRPQQTAPKAEAQKAQPSSGSGGNLAFRNTISSSKKILDEKYCSSSWHRNCKGQNY
jgi:2-oxoglutarate dehydrogenase E2 component (dihydrolipoamide succinyltransferase)